MIKCILIVLAATILLDASAHAVKCGGDFNTFIGAVSREAQAAGVSCAIIDHTLPRRGSHFQS